MYVLPHFCEISESCKNIADFDHIYVAIAECLDLLLLAQNDVLKATQIMTFVLSGRSLMLHRQKTNLQDFHAWRHAWNQQLPSFPINEQWTITPTCV